MPAFTLLLCCGNLLSLSTHRNPHPSPRLLWQPTGSMSPEEEAAMEEMEKALE